MVIGGERTVATGAGEGAGGEGGATGSAIGRVPRGGAAMGCPTGLWRLRRRLCFLWCSWCAWCRSLGSLAFARLCRSSWTRDECVAAPEGFVPLGAPCVIERVPSLRVGRRRPCRAWESARPAVGRSFAPAREAQRMSYGPVGRRGDVSRERSV